MGKEWLFKGINMAHSDLWKDSGLQHSKLCLVIVLISWSALQDTALQDAGDFLELSFICVTYIDHILKLLFGLEFYKVFKEAKWRQYLTSWLVGATWKFMISQVSR